VSGKSLLYTAAISLAVVVAYEKHKAGGKLHGPRIGN
jgi:hypothetical protein